MSVWGKVIGGVAGLMMGGPLGALVGAVAGHAVDKMRDADEDRDLRERLTSGVDPFSTMTQQAKQMTFSVAVIVLGAKMAKADGAVSRVEVNAFKEVFRIPPQEVQNVGRIFDAAKKDAEGYEPYARQVAWLFRDEPQVLEELLAGLFYIARADGALNPAETAFLQRVAEIFGLDSRAYERVRASTPGGSSSRANPYDVLGISASATNDEIKKVYRKLIRENHPDTLVAKGMPQEFIQVATERMAAINSAYDQIEKERGLK